jgi:predicted dithiol-disulfide oxidoreductase (DUF899 family)
MPEERDFSSIELSATAGCASTPRRRETMKMPLIVFPQEWEAARQHLLVKEKALTRARDALAAERRRMPWVAVTKMYEFDVKPSH